MVDARTFSRHLPALPARLLVIALAAAAAASCGMPGQAVMSRKAHMAREELVGMTRDEVLRCAGDPARAQQQGSREYFSYISGEPAIKHTRCIVTVRLQRGYVESVDYENPNGNLIGQSIPECLDVLDTCLEPPAEE